LIVAGYQSYDAEAEQLLLNKIWMSQSKLANYFYPQQELVSKTGIGAKVSMKYDTATIPYCRAVTHDTGPQRGQGDPSPTPRTAPQPRRDPTTDPGAHRRLLTLTTSKAAPKTKAPVAAPTTHASTDESTNQTSRAS
jgi:hypothetical protein